MKLAKAFIFFLCTFFSPISAQTNGILVLPFQVENHAFMEHDFVNTSSLSIDLQEATHFVLENFYQTELKSLFETRNVLQEVNFTEKSVLNSSLSQVLCKKSGAHVLVSGNVNISQSSKLFLKIISYNCSSGEIIKTVASKIQNKIFLQDSLSKLLKQTLHGLQSKENVFRGGSDFTKNMEGEKVPEKNLILVVDMSGSMREELSNLYKEIEYLKIHLNKRIRLSAILLENKDEVSIIKWSEDWNFTIKNLRKKIARGETTHASLLKALGVLERMPDIYNNSEVFFFTDFSLEKAHFNKTYNMMKLLKQKGLHLNFFTLATQDQSTREFWTKLSKYVNPNQTLTQSHVFYYQNFYLASRGLTTLIQKDDRYFVNQENRIVSFSKFMKDENESLSFFIPLVASDYKIEDLNFENLPLAFASLHKDKILRKEEKKSNIGYLMYQILKTEGSVGVWSGMNDEVYPENGSKQYYGSQKNSKEAYMYQNVRLLVRNEGKAFWIEVSSEILPIILERKKLFLGLCFVANPMVDGVVNLHKPFYIRDALTTPKLFLWTWGTIKRLRPDSFPINNILFLDLEILEIKNLKIERDIRQ